ncbi:MAG: hypothetical protein AB1896_18215, partial [Thermodesulfobacteriota bacterium]
RRTAQEAGPREMKKADFVVPDQYRVAAGIIFSLDRIHRRQKKEWDWAVPAAAPAEAKKTEEKKKPAAKKKGK